MPDGEAGFRRRLGPLIPVVAPAFMLVDAFLRSRLIAPNDGYMQMLPLRVLAARALRSGHLPLWNPYSFGGFPLLAESQVAALYPPNLLFLALPIHLANNLLVVASFSIAGLGAYVLAQHLVGDAVGSVVAGLGFGLCGFFFGHVGHQDMIAGIAWLPWMLLAFERLRERPSVLRLAVAALTLTLSALAGHPQMFFMMILILGVYAFALALQHRGWSRLAPLLAALAVVVAGAGLAAVQLMPTSEMASGAAHSRLSFADATSFSFSLSHLPLVFFPYLFGNILPAGPFTAKFAGNWSLIELAGYPGLAVTVLALVGLPAARRDRRAAALLVVAAVCVLGALGSSTPFGRLLYQVPIYNSFRAWDRYVVGFDLVAAILAAYGVRFLRDRAKQERRRAIRWAVAGLAAVCTAGVVAPLVGPVRAFVAPAGTAVPAIVIPVLFASVGTVAAILLTRGRCWTFVLVGAVLVDPIASFGYFFDWRTDSTTVAMQRKDYSGPPLFGAVPDAAGGIDRYLYTGSTPINLNTVRRAPPYLLAAKALPSVTDVAGLRSLNGYDPLVSEEYSEAVAGMATLGIVARPLSVWQPGSDVLDLLRVSLVVGDSAEGETALATASGATGERVPVAPLQGWKYELGLPLQEPGPLMRYERRPRLPEAYLVGAVVQQSRGEILRAIEGTTPFDPSASALVERRCALCDGMTRPGTAGVVASTEWGVNRVELRIEADRPAFLLVSQSWWPGWKATVDGRSAPVLRANGVIQGIPVGAGRHRVVLHYSAPGLARGAWSTVGTALLLAIAAGVERTRRRLSQRPPPDDGPASGPPAQLAGR